MAKWTILHKAGAVPKDRIAWGVSVAALAVALSAAAQGAPEGIIMHRTQAGTLDANGWAEASSDVGRFSVELPCLFNDFATEEDDSDAPGLKADSLGCRRPDQAAFLAHRIVYKQGKQGAEEVFRGMENGSMMDNASRTASTFKGFKTVTFEGEMDGRCGFVRFILADADIVGLMVEAPLAACGDIRASVDKFFSSLQIADKSAEH